MHFPRVVSLYFVYKFIARTWEAVCIYCTLDMTDVGSLILRPIIQAMKKEKVHNTQLLCFVSLNSSPRRKWQCCSSAVCAPRMPNSPSWWIMGTHPQCLRPNRGKTESIQSVTGMNEIERGFICKDCFWSWFITKGYLFPVILYNASPHHGPFINAAENTLTGRVTRLSPLLYFFHRLFIVVTSQVIDYRRTYTGYMSSRTSTNGKL